MGIPGVPPVPPQVQLMQVECNKCHTKNMFRQPAFRFFNHPDVSGLVFTHTKLDKCPECGTAYLCVLGGVDQEGHILLTWVPIEAQSSILAPTPENMQAAMMAQEINKKKNN